MPRYKVEYTITGEHDPHWDSSNGDSMIFVPCPSMFLPDDHYPYRIPKDAKVTEVLEDGYYLNPYSGALHRRTSGAEGVSWKRFELTEDKGQWNTITLYDELEYAEAYGLEKLDLHFSGIND